MEFSELIGHTASFIGDGGNEFSSLTIEEFENLERENNESDCPICLETNNDDRTVIKLPCEHYLHEECAKKWLLDKAITCPTCRNPVIDISKRNFVNELHENAIRSETEIGTIINRMLVTAAQMERPFLSQANLGGNRFYGLGDFGLDLPPLTSPLPPLINFSLHEISNSIQESLSNDERFQEIERDVLRIIESPDFLGIEQNMEITSTEEEPPTEESV